MTFLRRHWPDVVITTLILALLAGFVTVLTGGEQDADTQSPPAQAREATPSTVTEPDRATAGAVTETLPATRDAEDDALPVIPSQQDAATLTTQPVLPSDAGTSPTSDPELQVAPEQVTGDVTPTETPVEPTATTARVPTSRAGTPTRAEYRLSAGVYANEALARERTQGIVARGYVVHVIPIQDGVVAQVGPFADRDTATRALADIQPAHPGLVLYAPVGGEPAPSTSTEASPASQSTPTPTTTASITEDAQPGSPANREATEPQSQPPAQPAQAASTGPVYLQVGAFDRQERAADLVERLRSEGFKTEVNAPPGRVVRVLVGPFTGDNVTSAEQKLATLGLEHFRVR